MYVLPVLGINMKFLTYLSRAISLCDRAEGCTRLQERNDECATKVFTKLTSREQNVQLDRSDKWNTHDGLHA